MCCDDAWRPYAAGDSGSDCGCNGTPASGRSGLGLIDTSAWDGGAPSDTQDGWISRAASWAWSKLSGSSPPPCIGDPLTDPEVSGPPCPGETSDALTLAAWNAAPLAARAELWARAVLNNPQWRCHNPGDLLGRSETARVIRRAAFGGRDCRMSRDRGSLRPAWDEFVRRYGAGVSPGPGLPLVAGIGGRGALVVGALVAGYILLRPDRS